MNYDIIISVLMVVLALGTFSYLAWYLKNRFFYEVFYIRLSSEVFKKGDVIKTNYDNKETIVIKYYRYNIINRLFYSKKIGMYKVKKEL